MTQQAVLILNVQLISSRLSDLSGARTLNPHSVISSLSLSNSQTFTDMGREAKAKHGLGVVHFKQMDHLTLKTQVRVHPSNLSKLPHTAETELIKIFTQLQFSALGNHLHNFVFFK